MHNHYDPPTHISTLLPYTTLFRTLAQRQATGQPSAEKIPHPFRRAARQRRSRGQRVTNGFPEEEGNRQLHAAVGGAPDRPHPSNPRPSRPPRISDRG